MGQHTIVQLREKILQLSEKGKISRDITSLLDVGKSMVNNLLSKYRSDCGLKDKPRCGHPSKTSVRVDRLIKGKSTADHRKTATNIPRGLEEESHANINRRTVSRRLHQVGLIGRVGVKKPLISKKNRRARLEFAMQHREWTPEDWRKVAFSDESKFNLFESDGRR